MLGEVEDMMPGLEEKESRMRKESVGVRRLERFGGWGGGSGGLRVAEASSYAECQVQGLRFLLDKKRQ